MVVAYIVTDLVYITMLHSLIIGLAWLSFKPTFGRLVLSGAFASLVLLIVGGGLSFGRVSEA